MEHLTKNAIDAVVFWLQRLSAWEQARCIQHLMDCIERDLGDEGMFFVAHSIDAYRELKARPEVTE